MMRKPRHRKLYRVVIIIALVLVALLFWIITGIRCGEEPEAVSAVEQEPMGQKEIEVDPDKPMIALTFDDGPGKYTEEILQKLKECDARATFFMVGTNVEKYPEVIQQMEEIGCELGNHSTNHKKLVNLSEAEIKNEIKITDDAIAAAVGHGASLVRPPYGSVNELAASVIKAPLITWSLDTNDWKIKDAAKITEYVLSSVKDGDIVLMHDIHEFSKDSALEMIPKLIEQGYQLVTVSELAKARGIELENGVKYSHFHVEESR